MNLGIHIVKVIEFITTDWDAKKTIGMMIVTLLGLMVNAIFPLIALIILVFVDMRFGIRKHIKKKRDAGEKVHERSIRNLNSGGMRRTFSKMGDYLFLIIGIVVFEVFVLRHLGVNVERGNLTISTFTIFLLCLIEVKSIDENFMEIRGISILKSISNFFFKKDILKDINNEDNRRA